MAPTQRPLQRSKISALSRAAAASDQAVANLSSVMNSTAEEGTNSGSSSSGSSGRKRGQKRDSDGNTRPTAADAESAVEPRQEAAVTALSMPPKAAFVGDKHHQVRPFLVRLKFWLGYLVHNNVCYPAFRDAKSGSADWNFDRGTSIQTQLREMVPLYDAALQTIAGDHSSTRADIDEAMLEATIAMEKKYSGWENAYLANKATRGAA